MEKQTLVCAQRIISQCEAMLDSDEPPTPFDMAYLLRRIIPTLKSLVAENERLSSLECNGECEELLKEITRLSDLSYKHIITLQMLYVMLSNPGSVIDSGEKKFLEAYLSANGYPVLT